jgi:hypothetical protein
VIPIAPPASKKRGSLDGNGSYITHGIVLYNKNMEYEQQPCPGCPTS